MLLRGFRLKDQSPCKGAPPHPAAAEVLAQSSHMVALVLRRLAVALQVALAVPLAVAPADVPDAALGPAGVSAGQAASAGRGGAEPEGPSAAASGCSVAALRQADSRPRRRQPPAVGQPGSADGAGIAGIAGWQGAHARSPRSGMRRGGGEPTPASRKVSVPHGPPRGFAAVAAAVAPGCQSEGVGRAGGQPELPSVLGA